MELETAKKKADNLDIDIKIKMRMIEDFTEQIRDLKEEASKNKE